MARTLSSALRDRLTAQFGEQTTRTIFQAFSCTRLPTLRVNTLKTTDHAVMDTFRDDGIAFERVKDIPHALRIKNRTSEDLLAHPLTLTGQVYLQGVSSMIPPLALDVTSTMRVLDLCAAPGSKTSQLAARMENKGELIACEDNDIRVQKLRHTVTLQGAHVQVLHADATLLHHTFPEAFDAILADVPCSAEGRISLTDPRTFTFWSQKNILEHAKLQRRLLRSAYRMLKPGGTLVYSTCTLAPEENELQIAWFTQEYPDMRIIPFTPPLSPLRTTPFGSIILPSTVSEGFFVAKLIKNIL